MTVNYFDFCHSRYTFWPFPDPGIDPTISILNEDTQTLQSFLIFILEECSFEIAMGICTINTIANTKTNLTICLHMPLHIPIISENVRGTREIL